jgi:uncharacterized protein YeaO (DUF488 family)
MTKFTVKRIYELAEEDDGYRVLVDRLWPRGISKDRAALDEWAKDIAPSNELRKWFNHDPTKFKEFAKRYVEELNQNPKTSDIIDGWSKHPFVTLLYAARD